MPVLTMLILCIAPISFFSCRSVPQPTPADEAKAITAILSPPLPVPPVMEPVHFEDWGDGLWLSYNDYRALERNVIAMREYAARLEIIIRFYREEDK